jgi:hypothetical protein
LLEPAAIKMVLGSWRKPSREAGCELLEPAALHRVIGTVPPEKRLNLSLCLYEAAPRSFFYVVEYENPRHQR